MAQIAPPADLAHGAFSDTPPWILSTTDLHRLADVEQLRRAEEARIPALLRPRRLPPGARVARVVREIGGAVAMWRIREGRSQGSERRAGISRRLRVAAERLGPTYIKLGQIIAAGEGVFPDELVTEFTKCRDQVPAEPFDAVRQVVQGELRRPLEDVFLHFEREPVAAASIAQVHRAWLRAGPDGVPVEVVVKVQRPSVGRLVHHDLEVMAWLAPFLIGRIPVTALANPPALVEVFTRTIVEELDFRIEAANMVDIARSLAELDQRRFVVPRPHPQLVTRKVLVMERLDGFPFDAVSDQRAAGVDTHEVVRSHMIGLLEGAMISGIFHGDLHGGNLFVRPDGRTALLDFGMVGRLSDERRVAFLRLLVASTTNDVKGHVAAIRDLGALPADTDLDEVIAELGLDRPPIDPTSLSREELVHELNRVVRALLDFGARMPKELMLFAKNMVFLDAAIARLAPDLDLFAEIMSITTYFARTHGARIAADVGMRAEDYEIDLTGMKGSFGVDPSLESLTYRELRERRELIRRRLSARGRKAR
ncbi:MAG: AarF/ABC1/UbiB kinase family protein [Acidimicrobiales bacterium]|nr:AarF/ABC1/UbiB kinase family protein [Acidimicrobiales bacterium]